MTRLHTLNIFFNVQPMFSIFSAASFVTHLLPLPSQSQETLKLAMLHLRQTFLRILNSQNCLTKMQYRKFDGTATAMSKFSKMFDKNSISQIRGSCDDCDFFGQGGGRRRSVVVV